MIIIENIDVESGQSLNGTDYIIIRWVGNIGFGEYTLYKEGGNWKGDSKGMDTNADRKILKALLSKFAEEVDIKW